LRLISDPRADDDIESAFEWYENAHSGLGLEFLEELRQAYDRITAGSLKYQILRSSIRHALLRRFPYAVYFSVEEDTVVILAVLHVKRDPAIWQSRM
jgi:plasmid stabilization system protein ParE